MAGVPLFWKLAVEDVSALQGVVGADVGIIENPHVTLIVLGGNAARDKFSPFEFEKAQDSMQKMDGKEVEFTAVALLKTKDMIVVEVVLPDVVPCASGSPHLVVWHSDQVSRAARTVRALEMLDGVQDCTISSISPPASLRGRLQLERQSGDPMIFHGELLTVETYPRPTRQSEPRGHATFVSEDVAEKWAAPLADSLRKSAAGPSDLKLKANLQAPERPGHIYLRWGAAEAQTTAEDLGTIIEARLQQLML